MAKFLDLYLIQDKRILILNMDAKMIHFVCMRIGKNNQG